MDYPVVNREICAYCGSCVSVCPKDAIDLVDLHLNIDRSKCVSCKSCVKVCPINALEAVDESNIAFQSKSFRDYDLSKCKPLSYDAVVIGAGPGGSMSALALARQNVNVLLVEKRQEIGSPVRCAEGVSKRPLAELVDIDPKWIGREIHGGRIFAPDGSHVTIDMPNAAYVLERKVFDRDLAMLAGNAGAEVWIKSRAIDVIRENDKIAGVVIRRIDGDYAVKAKVVIAADGIESQVGRWAGIKTFCKPDDVDSCAQYLMTGIDINPNYCDFYLGQQIAPRGYAWIFPKGKNTANVGIGIGSYSGGKNALDYLNQFVKGKFGGNSSVISGIFGAVPVTGTLSEIVLDNFMMVGDSAHQNDPVSGGGLINAMIAGNIAGEVAGKAIKSGDTSRSVLVEYEKKWHKQIGRTFRSLKVIREGILRFSDDSLNNLAKVMANYKKLTMIELFWNALKSEPKLLLELRHLISMGWVQ
ncbi:MAG: geranylgeranyl reductase family protein [Candidatus Poribacteria bacterium]